MWLAALLEERTGEALAGLPWSWRGWAAGEWPAFPVGRSSTCHRDARDEGTARRRSFPPPRSFASFLVSG